LTDLKHDLTADIVQLFAKKTTSFCSDECGVHRPL